tara:strand:+ start:2545 stop:3972 length:1428 start_codon:yes stop_codon:yes gene_type:complete
MNVNTLIVDLDGTLVKTDCSLETLWSSISLNPANAFKVFGWFFKGRPYLKDKLFESSDLDAKSLPYNQEVISAILESKKNGSKVYLMTGSSQKVANKIQENFNFFDDVFGTSKNINLIGKNKLKKIREIIGNDPFSYIGDSSQDIPIWEEAEEILIVANNNNLEKKIIKKEKKITYIYKDKLLKNIFKVIRPYQWLKNFLVFVPFLIYENSGYEEFVLSSLGFISFCLIASSVYVLNDLLDIKSDRDHLTKKNRPFAAGSLALINGFWLLPLLLVSGLIVASLLGTATFLIVLIYLIITLFYSLSFKKKLILDVCILACLYTLRLIGGAIVIQSDLSPWLINFSIFFFFFLACIKRESELIVGVNANNSASRRSYIEEDKKGLSTLAIGSGLLSVLILLLYADSASSLNAFTSPIFLWFLSPIFLYWISRLSLLSSRGYIKEDPLLFALKDRISFFVGFGVITIIILARFINLNF